MDFDSKKTIMASKPLKRTKPKKISNYRVLNPEILIRETRISMPCLYVLNFFWKGIERKAMSLQTFGRYIKTIGMSHWQHTMVDGSDFLISFQRPNLLKKGSRWQLFQNLAPSTIHSTVGFVVLDLGQEPVCCYN